MTDEYVQQLLKIPAISLTFVFAYEERVMVNPQVSLLNLTLEAGIPGDVMWLLIYGKYIVSVTHHDRLFVDRNDDCLDEDIDGGKEDLFDVRKDNPVKEDEWAEEDIILCQQKCGF